MKDQDLRRRWERSREALRAIAAGIPPGQEDFRPAPGTMSLGEHALHAASAERTARQALTTTPGQWEWQIGIDLKHYPEIDSILAVLDAETELTRAYMGNLGPPDLARLVKTPWGAEITIEDLWYEWILHEVHHRGNLVTSLRVLGVTPPSIW
jgi:uncharacterized damage-inducible protein DinB